MALASLALFALRQLADRAAAGLAPSGQDHSAGARAGCLASEVDAAILTRATRHTWLALEIALSGRACQDRLGQWLAPAHEVGFRQQIESLLDLLVRAGLDGDDPDVCRRYSAELRAMRRNTLPPAEDLPDEQPDGDGSFLLGAAADGPSLRQIAGDLEEAGYPNLAHLVELRSLWDEPIFLGMLEFFLRRALRSLIDTDLDVPEAADDDCRCLEKTAELLDEREDEVADLLDRPLPVVGKAAPGQDAVDRLYQLGLSRARHGDYQQAAGHFTAALKLEPANAVLYVQRGDAYRLLCEYERALNDLNIALRLQPGSVVALISRATAFHLSGEQERAIADCTAALALDADQAQAYRLRAAAYAESGADEQAQADLTEAIRLSPEDDQGFYLRGLLRARQRDFRSAIEDFDHTLRLNRYHVLALLQRAHAYRRQADYRQALRDYSEVLRVHPGNLLALSGRGLAYKLKGDLDLAIADFSEALALGSDNPHDHYHRGVLYQAKGDLDRAQEDLEEAIRRQPSHWPALYCRGKLLLARGNYSLAIIDLTEVVNLNATVVPAWLSRAVAYDRLGKYLEGIEDATRAVELDESSAAAHLVRGVLRGHLGDQHSAIDDLTRAIELDDRLALAYHERGDAYILQGDYDRALADCHEFVKLAPGNALGYATRSIVYHFKGDLEQALTDYAQALRIDPKRMMTGWNASLAESARSEATQRLADYIDGLRPEAPAETPPPSEFRIVTVPHAAEPNAVQEAAPKPARKKKPAARVPDETIEFHIPAAAPETPIPPAAEETGLALRSEEPVEEAIPPQPKVKPARKKPKRRKPEPPPKPAVEAGPEQEIAEFLLDDEAEAPPSDELALAPESPQPEPEAPSERAVQPPKPKFNCPNCERPSVIQLAGEGRVRCEHCNSIFPMAAAFRPLTPKKPKVPPKPFFERWKKPLTSAAGVAVLLLVVFLFHNQLFGRGGRLRVYPARGKATYAGQPMQNATIFLHPINVKDRLHPRPQATVDAEGNFVLTSYTKDDGAPVGEYKVTVQWFDTSNQTGMPVNVLPTKYAKPETSDITMRIDKAKENLLPPITLGATSGR
jgi:tetratricopeptide (TPR) repeat protein